MQRWKAIPLGQRKRFPLLVPAFVVEVRSPTDRMKDLRTKMLVYLRNGVELAWLIDPHSRTVAIYRSGCEEPVELTDPETVSGEGQVSGFVLNLHDIYKQL